MHGISTVTLIRLKISSIFFQSLKIREKLLPKLKVKISSDANANDVISEDISTAWPADKVISNV